MRVAFRVDASSRIGTGHVIRCLTLAWALEKRGVECSFIQRLHNGNLVQAVNKMGFQSIELPPPPPLDQPATDEDYAAWLGVSQRVDADQCLEHLAELQPDILVVDHYGLDSQWEQRIHDQVGKIVVIDDLANRPHDCSLLVDQNYYRAGAERYRGLLADTTRVLSGPRYALLSDRYRISRPERPPDNRRIERILVYYGGVDPTNETARALRVLSKEEFAHLQLDVIVGINNPHAGEIDDLVQRRPNTCLHGQQNDLVELMLAADLVLGAGGTTTWERACLGLPAVVTTTAANQVPYNLELAADDLIAHAGHTSELTDHALADKLHEAIDSSGPAGKLARRSWHLVDGWGTQRIAELIMPTPRENLILRDATDSDIDQFFIWANETEARCNSFNQAPISWSEHVAWFERQLDSDDAWLWVLCAADQLPVGEARVQLRQGKALLGYTVDVDYRGSDWGKHLVQMIGDRWCQLDTGQPLFADIKHDNAASIACFENSACFRQVADSATHITYQLQR